MRFFKYKIELINDNPVAEHLKEGIVYVVGTKQYLKWAYLKCPCGCQDAIMLSLNKKIYPSWSVYLDKLGRANISPSIDRIERCKSHFWIQKGKVKWS